MARDVKGKGAFRVCTEKCLKKVSNEPHLTRPHRPQHIASVRQLPENMQEIA
jgi:hypothetical protein